MSKTDKTRPWRVRAAYRPLVSVHHHEHGECDLPPVYDPKYIKGWTGDTLCHWDAPSLWYKSRGWGCGCPRCNDQDGRRAKGRKARHAVRRIIEDQLGDM